MLKRVFCVLVLTCCLSSIAFAQSDCSLPPRLEMFGGGRVILNGTLNVRNTPSTEGALLGRLNTGDEFLVTDMATCINGLNWYGIRSLSYEPQLSGYIAEGADGDYYVEPVALQPTPTASFELPALSTPVPPVTDTPLPDVTPLTAADPSALGFVTWNWAGQTLFGSERSGDPALVDPFSISIPDVYAGDMPALPVDLSGVAFVTDTGLSANGLALLSQNGFVVSPGGFEQFDGAYAGEGGWSTFDGYSIFVTTDSMLHSFYLVFENLLTYLEQETLYPEVSNMVAHAYQAAEAQAQQAEGTPLETQARNVSVYYAVALQLLAPPSDETVNNVLFGAEPVPTASLSGVNTLITTLENADPSILDEAQPLVETIVAADGQSSIPFLTDTLEDFGLYRPRGHYTISPLYERYFRAVTWLGRVTFRAADASETQEAVLALRALENAPEALSSRERITSALEFIIGPEDNLGPAQYSPLAKEVFGDDLSLDAIADDTLLQQFQGELETLPPPAINTSVLPEGTQVEQLDEIGRGFRMLGQRFTIDAGILQQVIDPYIMMRTIPTALDVPAALGSDTAFTLSEQAGAADFPTYESQMTMLREQVNDHSASDWLANIYSGWLWTLQPYAVRSAESYPPLMNTDAWQRRDLQTMLSSYTELKHATILYTAQPMGGRGGGGPLPLTYGYVEPNPLVFARTAIIAQALYQGLLEQGLVPEDHSQDTYLTRTHSLLQQVARYAAYLADMAQRELNGEGLSEDDHYFIQYAYGQILSGIREDVQVMQSGPPKPVALVTDIASNGVTGEVLQVAVGQVDYIFVVIPTPNGLQVGRGGVYSYYEFVGEGGQRMTDEEWRAQVDAGTLPPRPEWISAFFSE